MKHDLVRINRYTEQDLSRVQRKIIIGGLPVHAHLLVPEGWTVSQTGESENVRFSFNWARVNNQRTRFTSHFVREKFMEIADADHARDFFEHFGPLNTSATSIDEVGTAESVTFAYVQLHQRWFKEAMLWAVGKPPANWSGDRDLMTTEGRDALRRDFALNLLRPPTMTLEMGLAKTAKRNQVVVPFFRVESTDVASAIWAAIYLDKARKLDGAACAHCGEVFIRSGRQDKKYCDRTQCNGTRRVTEYRREQKRKKAEAINNGKA